MVARGSGACALIGACLSLGLAGCTGDRETAPALQPGSVAPAVLAAAAPGRLRVTWVFDGADLLRCRSSARELRHIQMRFAGRVDVAAIALDADRAAVESFLRFNRVTASVRYSSAKSLDGADGLRWPALYLVRGDTVAATYLGVPLDDSRSLRQRDVEGAIVSLLGRSGADVNERRPTISRRRS